jgi:succinate-semialdehyde dehydrogenase/glutarate-semialdehyde dehydrogenase
VSIRLELSINSEAIELIYRIDPSYISTHGPLIHGRALAKVEDHVKDAVDKGANLLLGGSRLTGPEYPSENYYEATIIGDVPEDAACLQEETFGPMAAVVRFKSEEEVLRLANDTDVGLAG